MDFVAKQTEFALRLTRQAALTSAVGSNLALAPIPIHLVLCLLATGSRGATLHQFLSVLGSGSVHELQSLASRIISDVLVDGSTTGGPQLSYVGGGWAAESLALKPSFEEIAASLFKTEVKSVDFTTKAEEIRKEINKRAENSTAGLIKELLPFGSIDKGTALVFASALHFKGAWDEKFDASETRESSFHLLGGSSVRVPFMTTTRRQFFEAYDGFKVLRLPYKKSSDQSQQFSMCIFLPDARDGLWSLLERMSSESRFLDRHRPALKRDIGEFMIPKFKISFDIEASQVLKDLGLVLPFTNHADFTDMVDLPPDFLTVLDLFHKSVVEVDEEGTEAAAATAMCFAVNGRCPDFKADHPFVFLIREETTGALLFTGHVLNPSSS